MVSRKQRRPAGGEIGDCIFHYNENVNSCHLGCKQTYYLQISEHILAPNKGHCAYYPSNVFRNTRGFENWGISPKDYLTRLKQSCASENDWFHKRNLNFVSWEVQCFTLRFELLCIKLKQKQIFSDNIKLLSTARCNSSQHFAGNSELFPFWRHSFRNVVHSWHLRTFARKFSSR